MGRGFYLPTVTGCLPAFCLNIAMKTGVFIRPQHCCTAVAFLRRGNINVRAFQHHHFLCVPDVGIFALPASAHIHLSATLAAGGRDAAVFIQQDMLAFHHNFAATATVIVSHQGAGMLHHAAVSPVQHNITVFHRQPLCFHHPTVIQHGIHQHIFSARRQQNLTITGADQPAVFHQGIHHAAVNGHGSQTGIIQLQGNFFRSSQDRPAFRCADGATVSDPITGEYDKSAFRGGQVTLVYHLSLPLLATKNVLPVHEVFVFDVPGCGNQPCGIYTGPLTKQHPVGVYQKNPPVGIQVPHNVGFVPSHHPVQRNRTAVRLIELNRVALANIKAVPVQHGMRTVLVNIHLILSRLLNAGAAGHHLSPHRKAGRQCRGTQSGQNQNRKYATGQIIHHADHIFLCTPGSVYLSWSGCDFTDDHNFIAAFVKFQFIDMVHLFIPAFNKKRE